MIKKISAIILALVLCLSVMVVPVSAAAELNGTEVAFALEWDKEYYKPGDTATLYLYLAVEDATELYTGVVTIGLNSAFISQDDNDPASCIEGSDVCNSFYKDPTQTTAASQTAYQTKIESKNTAEENETYDWYIRTALNINSSGDHPNVSSKTNGLAGSEIDPSVPFLTYTFTVSASAPDGEAIPAGMTSGSISCSPKQLYFKEYTNPGSTTKADIAAAQYDISAAVATATVGEPAAACDHSADKITWTTTNAATYASAYHRISSPNTEKATGEIGFIVIAILFTSSEFFNTVTKISGVFKFKDFCCRFHLCGEFKNHCLTLFSAHL